MKTKVSFTVNWLYVLFAINLLWSGWVTLALKDTIEVHQEIVSNQKHQNDYIIDLYDRTHELKNRGN